MTVLRIILQEVQFHNDGAPGTTVESTTTWDSLEWGQTTIIKSYEARAQLAQMVAQSINDWVTVKEAENRAVAHKAEREKAMSETEQILTDKAGKGDDDVSF